MPNEYELDWGEVDNQTEATEILKEESREEEAEGYVEGQINWLDDNFYDTWDKVKGHTKKLWDHKGKWVGVSPKWFFLAHSKDIIIGKPQLIEAVQKKIPFQVDLK